MENYYQLDSLDVDQLSLLYPASAAYVKGGDDFCANLVTFIHCHLAACSVEQKDLPSKCGPWAGVTCFWLKLFSQPIAEHLRKCKQAFLCAVADKCVPKGQLVHTDAASAEDGSTAPVVPGYSKQIGTLSEDHEVTMETESQQSRQDVCKRIGTVKCEPLCPDAFTPITETNSSAIVVPATVNRNVLTAAADKIQSTTSPPLNSNLQKEFQISEVNAVAGFSLAGLENSSLLDESVPSTRECVTVKQEQIDEDYDVTSSSKFVFDEVEAAEQSQSGLGVSAKLDLSPDKAAVSSTASSGTLVKLRDGTSRQTQEADADASLSVLSTGSEEEDAAETSTTEPFYCCSCEVSHFSNTHQCFLCRVNGSTCDYNYSCCSYDALVTHQQYIHPDVACSHVVTGHIANSDVSQTENAPGNVSSLSSSSNVFKCRHCAFVSPFRSALQRHMSHAHAEASTSPSACEDCHKVFGVDHLMSFRCNCSGCKFKACSAHLLEVHKRISGHQNEGNTVLVNQEIKRTPQVCHDHLQAMARLDAAGTPFFTLANGRKIYRPNKLTTIQDKWKCPACDYLTAPFKQSMTLHINKFHKNINYEIQLKKSLFPCLKCGVTDDKQHTYDWTCTCDRSKKFCWINDFKDHIMEYHHDIELMPNTYKFFCPFCEWSDLGSLSGSVLKDHLEWHGLSCRLCEGLENNNRHGYTVFYKGRQDCPYVTCTHKRVMIKVKLLLVGRAKTASTILPDGITTPPECALSSSNETIITYTADPEDLLKKFHSVSQSSSHSSSDNTPGDTDIVCNATTEFFKVAVGSNTFPCYYCSSQFESIARLDAHIENMHVDLHKYTCRLCPSFKASRKTNWTSHMASAHNVCTHLMDHFKSTDGYYCEELAKNISKALCSDCLSKTDVQRKKRRKRRKTKRWNSFDGHRQIEAGGVMGSREIAAAESPVIEEEITLLSNKEDLMAEDNEYEISSVSDDSDEDYQPTVNSSRRPGRTAEKRKSLVSSSAEPSKKPRQIIIGPRPEMPFQPKQLMVRTSQANGEIAKFNQTQMVRVFRKPFAGSSQPLNPIIVSPGNIRAAGNSASALSQRIVRVMLPKNGNNGAGIRVGAKSLHTSTTSSAKIQSLPAIAPSPKLQCRPITNVPLFPQPVVMSKFVNNQSLRVITLPEKRQSSNPVSELLPKPPFSSTAVCVVPAARPQTMLTTVRQSPNSFSVGTTPQPGFKQVAFVKNVLPRLPLSSTIQSTPATSHPQKVTFYKVPQVMTVTPTANMLIGSKQNKTSTNTSKRQ